MTSIDRVSVLVSRHADGRARKRLGLSRKAIARMASIAFADGLPVPYRSQQYGVDRMARATEAMQNGRTVKLHSGYVWIFGQTPEGNQVLVSVIPSRAAEFEDENAKHHRKHKANYARFVSLRKRAGGRA